MCDFAVNSVQLWCTPEGTLWLSSALRAGMKSSTQMVACSTFPGPKTPGLTLYAPVLCTDTVRCWLVWLQPQSAPVAPLEKQQQDRGDIVTHDWINPCSAKGWGVSGMSPQMGHYCPELLSAPRHQPGSQADPVSVAQCPLLGQNSHCWCGYLC